MEKDKFDQEFLELQEMFLTYLESELSNLNALMREIQEDKSKSNILKISSSMHKLKGEGGSFDFPIISSIASKIEDITNLYKTSDKSLTEKEVKLISKYFLLLGEVLKKAKEGNREFPEEFAAISNLI